MLGSLDPQQNEVTVVGAGISGLLIAYNLDKKGYHVNLIEASSRAGGLIKTEKNPYGISESALHSVLCTEAVQDLFAELDVPLVPVNPGSKARYVAREGALRRFPLSPTEALQALFKASLPSSGLKDGATLEEWARQFLGEPSLKYLLTPMVHGIYGATPAELSVRAAFPSLQVAQGRSLLNHLLFSRKNKKSSKSRPKMMAPRDGMSSLVHALEGRLRVRLGERFQLGTEVAELPASGNVILTVPSSAAARLLGAAAPELSRLLKGVKYSPLISATVFVKKADLGKIPTGVGVLMSESKDWESLGILFNSSAFPYRTLYDDMVSLSVFMGGTKHPELLKETDEQLLKRIQSDLSRLFQFKSQLLPGSVIHRWTQAVPQYNFDLEKVWRMATETWCSVPGHILFGNYTGQVSLRGMIDSLAQLPG